MCSDKVNYRPQKKSRMELDSVYYNTKALDPSLLVTNMGIP